MISQSEIREKLNALISKNLGFSEFEDWLAARSWNMHLDSDSAAQSLAGAVELRLAEYSSDHLSWEQMIDEFRALLDGILVMSINEPLRGRTALSIAVGEPVQVLVQDAEIRPLTV